jgi:hypothetical protein
VATLHHTAVKWSAAAGWQLDDQHLATDRGAEANTTMYGECWALYAAFRSICRFRCRIRITSHPSAKSAGSSRSESSGSPLLCSGPRPRRPFATKGRLTLQVEWHMTVRSSVPNGRSEILRRLLAGPTWLQRDPLARSRLQRDPLQSLARNLRCAAERVPSVPYKSHADPARSSVPASPSQQARTYSNSLIIIIVESPPGAFRQSHLQRE